MPNPFTIAARKILAISVKKITELFNSLPGEPDPFLDYAAKAFMSKEELMGMFRGTGNSEMNVKNMGIGSTVLESPEWLIIETAHATINILNMNTFTLQGKATVVEDIHHISSNELRACLGPINLAFSDFTFNPEGLKSRKR